MFSRIEAGAKIRLTLVFKLHLNLLIHSTKTHTNSEIHNRSTSFANLNFHCPVFKKNTQGRRTFSVRTIRNWNELSLYVKTGEKC